MLQISPYYAQIMPDYAPLCSLDLLLSEFKDESISLPFHFKAVESTELRK